MAYETAPEAIQGDGRDLEALHDLDGQKLASLLAIIGGKGGSAQA